MGLKGYRLWVMGQLDSNVQRPTVQARVAHRLAVVRQNVRHRSGSRAVALQVAFERQILKPAFSLDRF
jgi:hypothetical protein